MEAGPAAQTSTTLWNPACCRSSLPSVWRSTMFTHRHLRLHQQSTSSQLTTNLTTLWTYYVLVISSILLSRLGVKATTLKAKNFASKAKAKAKDLAFKAKDDIKANVTMVRCSVKTSKHRRLLQGW